MLDPKRCVITRNPVLKPDGNVEYTATMTFHIREDIQCELEQRDFSTDGALDPRVVERLQRLVWKAIYGDLIAPVTHLIAEAKKVCNPSLVQSEQRINLMAAQLITMLKLRIAEPKKTEEPQPGSS